MIIRFDETVRKYLTEDLKIDSEKQPDYINLLYRHVIALETEIRQLRSDLKSLSKNSSSSDT